MNIGDYDGRTALHIAASKGHFKCVHFLLKMCNVNSEAKDRLGNTALSEAIEMNHSKIATLLQQHNPSAPIQGNGKELWKKLMQSRLQKPVMKVNQLL